MPKLAAFAVLAAPALILLTQLLTGGLGPLPERAVLDDSGRWSMRLLVVVLAVTPARQLLGWHWLAGWRRMLGLFAAFYAAVHVVAYVLDLAYDWPLVAQEILERRYLTIGFLALALMVPLVATSTNAAIRRLGGVRWRRLQSLVYPVVIGALAHDIMTTRLNPAESLALAGLVGWLLGYRLHMRWAGRYRIRPHPPSITALVAHGVAWTTLTIIFELVYVEFATNIGSLAVINAYITHVQPPIAASVVAVVTAAWVCGRLATLAGVSRPVPGEGRVKPLT